MRDTVHAPTALEPLPMHDSPGTPHGGTGEGAEQTARDPQQIPGFQVGGTMNDPIPFDHYAILELFGHQRLAGRVTEATIGGCSFLRVDVPSVQGSPPFTRFYGQGAIYALTIVEEAVALAALAKLCPAPVDVYLLPRGPKQLAFQTHRPDDEEMEDDGGPRF